MSERRNNSLGRLFEVTPVASQRQTDGTFINDLRDCLEVIQRPPCETSGNIVIAGLLHTTLPSLPKLSLARREKIYEAVGQDLSETIRTYQEHMPALRGTPNPIDASFAIAFHGIVQPNTETLLDKTAAQPILSETNEIHIQAISWWIKLLAANESQIKDVSPEVITVKRLRAAQFLGCVVPYQTPQHMDDIVRTVALIGKSPALTDRVREVALTMQPLSSREDLRVA